MILSVQHNIFHGRVYHIWYHRKTSRSRRNMHRLTNCKISEKQPVFKDKSCDSKKVIIVRRILIQNYMCTTIFRKCWYILCYCKPNSKVNKKV